MQRDATVRRAKAGYVAVARCAGSIADRTSLFATVPPRTHRMRHWMFSLTRVHDSLGMAALDVPWWTYRAIDEVEAWLARHGGRARVFEYGSGASTLWLAARSAHVDTVEHDPAFAALMRGAFEAKGNIDLHLVPPTPSSRPLVPSAKEGFTQLDFADYIAVIDSVPGPLDLVVIDGRGRAACLDRAVRALAPDGLIVFDNSRRRRYRDAIRASGLVERPLGGLTPTLPYPDHTSLLSRTPL